MRKSMSTCVKIAVLFTVLLEFASKGAYGQTVLPIAVNAPFEATIWTGSVVIGTGGTAGTNSQFTMRPSGSGALLSSTHVVTISSFNRIPPGGLSVSVGRVELFTGIATQQLHHVTRVIRRDDKSGDPDVTIYQVSPPFVLGQTPTYNVSTIGVNPNVTADDDVCVISGWTWRTTDYQLTAGNARILDKENFCKNDKGYFCTATNDLLTKWDGGLMVCHGLLSGLYSSHIRPPSDPLPRSYFDVSLNKTWLEEQIKPPGPITGAASAILLPFKVMAVTMAILNITNYRNSL